MKVILLFDSDKPDNRYREYTLNDSVDGAISNGDHIVVEFCHPDHGEIMMASPRKCRCRK